MVRITVRCIVLPVHAIKLCEGCSVTSTRCDAGEVQPTLVLCTIYHIPTGNLFGTARCARLSATPKEYPAVFWLSLQPILLYMNTFHPRNTSTYAQTSGFVSFGDTGNMMPVVRVLGLSLVDAT